jgi:hypothetical protein
VYVKTDGFKPPEKTMMERMIATGEMPVTVGVFVRPGDLPAPEKGLLSRRNRCFEYDGVSDANVRFLDEELLPWIAKEYQLNLSTDGNDRCISGGSSGGIAAFTAAWHRPEAFSRVYAASGSWVAFRGGHEFPTMVRKFEAKPIRAFLSTGTRDMENAAGDWFLLDQEMDKALKFSGYDYQFRIINGGHVAGYMDNYQEAMAYLWRGWPERVKTGPSAPRVQDILIPGENWQLAAYETKDAHAPACNARGETFFIAGNELWRIGLDGELSRLAADAKQASGLAIGANGHLYSVSDATGQILDYGASDRTGDFAADSGHARRQLLCHERRRPRQRMVGQKWQTFARGHGPQASDRTGLSSRSVVAGRHRGGIEVYVQLPDCRQRRTDQQGAFLLASRGGLGRRHGGGIGLLFARRAAVCRHATWHPDYGR